MIILVVITLILITSFIISYYNTFKNYNNFNNIIDKIYVINMEKDVDRREKILKKAKKQNILVKIFTAVDGSTVSPTIINKYFSENNLNPGQIGCALSHILVYKDIIKNNYNNCIILEDDSFFTSNFIKKINNTLNLVNNNYDMIYLGGTKLLAYKPRINKNIYRMNVGNKFGNWGTFGLLVNINFIKQVYRYIITNKISIPIDEFLKTQYDNKNIYVRYPLLVLHDDNNYSHTTNKIRTGDLNTNKVLFTKSYP